MFDTYSFVNPDYDDSEIVKDLGLPPIILQPIADAARPVTFKAPQQLAVRFGLRAKRFILSFDKGMGKTLTYLRIAQETGVERIVILCTKNAMLAQRREIRRYFPAWSDNYAFVKGSAAQRAKIWHDPNIKVFICTYAAYLADSGNRTGSSQVINMPQWALNPPVLICDEYHKVLRNRDSKMHKLMKKNKSEYLILSSGSASNKGPHSMWTALNIINPKLFSSYWKFVGTYCVVEHGKYGQVIQGVKNQQGFRNAMAPYMFHRKKDLKDYPLKSRSALEVQMEPWQKKIHDQLRKELFALLPGGDVLIAPNTLAATMKIRQFMVCPKFFDPSLGWGAGLEAILEDYQDSELSHIVINVPFVKPIPLLKAFCKQHQIPVESLQGGLDVDEMEQTIARWTKNGGWMIQSIQYAESYELPAARYGYFLGCSYDPEQNSQAEDRQHRDIRVTPYPVHFYYVKHVDSYEERVMEIMAQYADDTHSLLNQPLGELFL